MSQAWTVAVLWRGDEDARRAGIASNERLRPVFEALAEVGIEARPVVHRDEIAASVRDELLAVDGVLVWIDPIGRGEDRRVIDAILREVAAAGRWVSAHPDVVAAMGTKEVLHRTRQLGWGTDVHRYETLEDLHDGLRAGCPRARGCSSPGTATAASASGRSSTSPAMRGRRRAGSRCRGRDTTVEEVQLDELARPVLARVRRGRLHHRPAVPATRRRGDDPLLPRRRRGRRLRPSERREPPHRAGRGVADHGTAVTEDDVPGRRIRTFAPLRALVEHEWVPGMRELLDLAVGRPAGAVGRRLPPRAR